jgi:hypothetical protein
MFGRILVERAVFLSARYLLMSLAAHYRELVDLR